MELIDQEIEKSINQQILETTQRLFAQVEEDLNSPERRKMYVSGERDEAVMVNSDPLLEAIALKIIEKNALIECTFDDDLLDFLTEELYFYIDLYYAVVTTLIDLAAIRREDISDSTSYQALFSVMEIHMASMKDVEALDHLRSVLEDLVDDYSDKPELQKSIQALVPKEPEQQGVYSVEPPKELSEYQANDVLATIDPDEDVDTTSVGGLPPGVKLDTKDGSLTVDDQSLLEKGVYVLHIETTDAEDGVSVTTVDLPIGRDGKATYTVNPYKKVTDHRVGDVLATVTDPDGEIISAKLIVDSDLYELSLPEGVALNTINGEITVSDNLLLVPGTHYLSIATIDIKGLETLHEVQLFFGIDHDAVYKVEAPNKLTDYKNEQVLATVSDVDGGVVAAQLTDLPNGVALDADTGNLFVEDTTALKEGTYKFNILTVASTGQEKPNAVELTIGEVASPYRFVVEPYKKLQAYANEDKLAGLNDPTAAIDKATIVRGRLPEGTHMEASNCDIKVYEKEKLRSGSYDVKIALTPTDKRTELHEVKLVIEPNYKAVYRVVYGKDIFDYENGELIAEVIDCDEVTSVELTSGEVPPGTTLDTTTGNITISDTAALVAGKYVLEIKVSDAEAGETDTRIALFFSGIDTESVYTVLPARAVDSYQINDLIATVEDDELGVVKAEVTQGALPLGTTINTENGEIYVSDPDLLRSGTFDNIFIKTIDAIGGSTESEITIVFLDDLAITYNLYEPQVVTSYNAGDVLSDIEAADGAVKSVVLSDGNLPAGTKLNSITGEVTVSLLTSLVAGNYPISLLVTDVNGGQTTLSFELVLLEDEDAVWWVIPPTPLNELSNGQIIAAPTDPNGPIIKAALQTYGLPQGMVLDRLSGTISITDVKRILPNSYPLTITTYDIAGGVTTATIRIIIQKAVEEDIYVIEKPRIVDTYAVDDRLAFVKEEYGPITSADILSGEIPAGTVLDADGTVKVADTSTLATGRFTAEIRTTNSSAVEVDSIVVIEILEDTEAVYDVAPPTNIDTVRKGMLLAAVSDPDAAIITADLIGGVLMPGTVLYRTREEAKVAGRHVGDIVVETPEKVIPGIYTNIQIESTDSNGGKTQFNLTMEITPDNDAIYKIQFSRDVHSLRNGDVIAYPIDFDGAIIRASLVGGTLHSGMALNTKTGAITVESRTQVAGGFQHPQLSTTDATGGITDQVIGIEVEQIPDRSERDIRRLFIQRFTERLDEFEVLFADRLYSEFTDNRSYIDNAKPVADTIKTDLDDSTIDNSYWNGSKDSYIKTNFLAITDPVKEGIITAVDAVSNATTEEELLDATDDLALRTGIYGEIYESMLDLTGYRRSDIPNGANTIMQTMFDDLDAQLDEVRAIPEVAFIIENITVIRDATSQRRQRRLRERLTDLLT